MGNVHAGGGLRAWRKVLVGAALHVCGVLFQQTLVSVAFHIHGRISPEKRRCAHHPLIEFAQNNATRRSLIRQ